MKNEQYLITLSTAASRGDLKTIKEIQDFPLDAEGQNSKRIPLHWAALSGQVAVAKYLVANSRKESIDHQDKDGYSPLILSVLKGGKLDVRLSMIECLLELNANPVLNDNKGKTALMYIMPILNSRQAKENSALGKQVKNIVAKMKDFAIKLAEKNNEYLIFNRDGSVMFYSKPRVDSINRISDKQYATFTKIPDCKLPRPEDRREDTIITTSTTLVSSC